MPNTEAVKQAKRQWGQTYSDHVTNNSLLTTAHYTTQLKDLVNLDSDGVELMVQAGYRAMRKSLVPALHRSIIFSCAVLRDTA